MLEEDWLAMVRQLDLPKAYRATNLAATGVSLDEFLLDPLGAMERVADLDPTWCDRRRLSATRLAGTSSTVKTDAGACGYGRAQHRRQQTWLLKMQPR